jgi:Flp pilus assembly protein TadG
MKGAVAVELAIMITLLIVMAVGIAEFGRAFYEYNTLTKAVRDGVRLLSQHDATDTTYATYVMEAKCLVVHGSVDCSGPALLPKLEISMVNDPVTSTVTTALGNTLRLVTVTINGYVFDFAFNPLIFYGGDQVNIPFGPISATMRQI